MVASLLECMHVCTYMYKIRIAYQVDSHFPAIDGERGRKKGWGEKVEELTGLISAAAPTEGPHSLNSAVGKKGVRCILVESRVQTDTMEFVTGRVWYEIKSQKKKGTQPPEGVEESPFKVSFQDQR